MCVCVCVSGYVAALAEEISGVCDSDAVDMQGGREERKTRAEERRKAGLSGQSPSTAL